MRLEATDLGFGYPERVVGHVDRVALDPGEVLCILGPNGCGKTTLFKTLLGLLPPQSGAIRLGGDNLGSLPRIKVARRLAYVPQAAAAPFPYTVLDLVLMGRVAHRGMFSAPRREDREDAMTALENLGIGCFAHRDVTRLSGGQRQLVMIARAIAQQAPLIVMDEPTASLDFGNQARVLTEVRKLAERGAGIILSTHDPDHAFAIASRVILLQDGRLVAAGPPIDVLTTDRLLEVYGVPVTIATLESGQRLCAPDLSRAVQQIGRP
ncbi:MAG: ABC transporter ATP-binding protein [Hyphomicrobium sp.]